MILPLITKLPPNVRDELARRVRDRTGLVFEGPRAFALDAAIQRICVAAECTPESLLERLDAGHLLWSSVIEALTVGESYFFRDPAHFQPFTDRLLEHGRVRVWSAGCAAGEEPHSLAIEALETIGDAAIDRVKIWASDINPAFLQRASAGRYREWAVRGLAPEILDKYFQREGAELVLDPRVRRMVTFFPANLIQRTTAWPTELDLLYCRNVLIYFSLADVPGVMRDLAACLAPGGRLVLGPADPQPDPGIGLSRAREHGFTSWIAGPPPASSAEVHVSALAPSPLRLPHRGRRAAVRPESREPTRRHTRSPAPPREAPAPESRALCELARALADRGEMDEATQLAGRAIAEDPFDPAPYLVRAVVEQHRGRHAAALRDARRALLLDASLGYAHVVRAASELALGRHPAARRSIQRARRLLQLLPESTPVPESGAMHRSEILSICASLEAAAEGPS